MSFSANEYIKADLKAQLANLSAERAVLGGRFLRLAGGTDSAPGQSIRTKIDHLDAEISATEEQLARVA